MAKKAKGFPKTKVVTEWPKNPPTKATDMLVLRSGGKDTVLRAVHNVMYGGFCWEAEGTPWSCSVASEAYWSS